MRAEIINLAEAIKDELARATFSLEFSLTRAYLPQYEPADLDTLRVTVVPKGLERATLNRGYDRVDYEIDVAVQQRAEPTDHALDPLMQLVQEIIDHFSKNQNLSADWHRTGFSRPLKKTNNPIYDQKQLFEKKTFTSLITFTVPVSR